MAGRTSVKPQWPVLIVAPAATAASSASEPRKLGHSRPPGSFFKRIRSEHPMAISFLVEVFLVAMRCQSKHAAIFSVLWKLSDPEIVGRMWVTL